MELTLHKAYPSVMPSLAGFSGYGAPGVLCRKDLSQVTLLPLIPQMPASLPLTDNCRLWGEEVAESPKVTDTFLCHCLPREKITRHSQN